MAVADDAVNAVTAVLACYQELRAAGAMPVAAALLSPGRADAVVTTLSVPFYAAARLDSEVWPSARCPLCARGVPLSDALPPDDRPG